MPDAEQRMSVYDQIGGEAAILVTVETFYQRVLGDPLLQPFFEDIDMAMLKRQQVDFFSQALGGPNIYRGPDMKTVHANMVIEQRHFDRVAHHLVSTLQFLGVAPEHIETVVQTVGPLAAEIVNTAIAVQTETISTTQSKKKKRKEQRMGQNGSQKNGGAATMEAPADMMDLEGKVAAIDRSQAVIEFHLDGTIITANDNFLQTMGYTLPEIQGQHHRMFAPPGVAESPEYAAFWAKLNRGEFDSGRYKRIGKGGKEIWIQASYNPVLDEQGKPYKVVKFAMDITDSKIRSAELESKMDAINKAQAVIEFNLDGTIITANENFLITLGYSLPEIQGKHHRMFADPAYAASPEYAAFWEKLNKGEFEAGVYKRFGKGGKEVWIQASYNPVFNADGVAYKVIKYATDITEFKKLNEEYEARNQAVGNGNAVIDFTPDGIILDANENFCVTVGYTLDEIKGKHHRMFCDPTYAASPEYAAFWAKLNRGEFDAGAYKRIGKGGKEVWIQASYNPIVDSNGQVLKVVKFATDITEAKQNELAATQVKNMMENMPTNVMYVDRDLVLTYMNPRSKDTLRTLEHLLPVKVDQMMGTCIDVFHKNPAHQRQILSDPKNLPYQGHIQLGEETLDLLVNAIYDKDGNYIGAMATWEVITKKLEQERQIKDAAEREREHQQKLQAGVDEIAQIGSNLAGASEELTSVSAQMGTTAEETSSQANVVAAASEEVSTNVQSVSTGSEEMTAAIQEIAQNTTEAAKVAAQAVSVAEQTNDTVGKLGQSSAEIGSIIKVINSIAQQTNLLALNATIEAARAGEAGKGFAVVANEVKELAKETTKATESISRMIETIQGDTKGSVDAIAQITTIIKQVNDYMNTIASAVEEQTVTTNEMARNVTEASKGSMEISSNIVTVAEAAKSTTEGATQTQQAAAELARMAADLQKVVTTLT